MRWGEARAVGAVVATVGAAAFVVLAVVLVPWHPYPGGALQVPSASSEFSADFLARATHFSHVARWLERSSLAVSVIVAALLGLTRARVWVTRWLRGPWPVRVLCAVAVVVAIGQVATLPFSIVLQHEEHAYGLSNSSWALFFRDLATSAAVNIVMTVMILIALVSCVRLLPRLWPAVAALVLGALVLIGSFVYPLLVAPLFEHDTPLPDGELRTKIMALAAQEGVHLDDVLVSDASRRTTELNAYVIGFGDTRRVVLYDTLVDQLPQGQTLAVVAHELGHAKHNDVLDGTLLGVSGVVFGTGLVALLVGPGLTSSRRDRRRVAANVPLLLAIVAIGSLLATPVENVISRKIETRADVASLVTTRDEASFIELQKQLAISSLTDPTPPALSQWIFGSHPTALQRIALAHRLLD